MPRFNPGDRVKCIRLAPYGQRFGIVGRIYTVVSAVGSIVVLDGIEGRCSESRFELLHEEVPAIAPESTTFYTLVYKSRGMASKKIMGFESEQNFEQKRAEVLRHGGEVLGTKKLKLSNV